MADIACIGSAHLDIFIDLDESVGTDRRGEFNVSVGGTGYNIACNLKQLGLDVSFVTALKENSLFSSLVLQKIKEAGLDLDKVVILEEIKEEAGFVAFRKEKDLLFSVNSTPIGKIDLSYLSNDNEKICFLDLNNSPETIKNLLDKYQTCYISCVSESKILKLADVLPNENIKAVFCNRFEILSLLKSLNIEDVDVLSRNNPHTLFVITKDKYGVDIWQNGEVKMFDPVKINFSEVANFSGAGDAFASAFVYSREFLQKDVQNSVYFANEFVKKVITSQTSNINANNILYDFNQMVFTDQLTNLFNRSFLMNWLDTNRLPFCALLIFDIDHFKNINDTYGHDIGDIALKAFADILKKSVRKEDLVVRMGGEEFLVIMKLSEFSQAYVLEVADRIRKYTEENLITVGDNKINYTISCGIVMVKHLSKEKFSQYYKEADEVLYDAKVTGRNKIEIKNAMS